MTTVDGDSGRDTDRFCGAKKRQGEGFCRRPAGWGTDHVGIGRCKLHGGKTPSQRQNAAVERQRLALGAARAELDRLGVAIEVEPAEAMLAMVHEAAGNVAFLRTLVQELYQGVSQQEIEFGPEGQMVMRGEAAIAGLTGNEKKTNEAAPHVLVVMYDAERERLVRWAKACRDAGVDERRVQLAEEQGRMLATVMNRVSQAQLLLALELLRRGVTEEQARREWAEKVPGIFRAEIAAVTATREA